MLIPADGATRGQHQAGVINDSAGRAAAGTHLND